MALANAKGPKGNRLGGKAQALFLFLCVHGLRGKYPGPSVIGKILNVYTPNAVRAIKALTSAGLVKITDGEYEIAEFPSPTKEQQVALWTIVEMQKRAAENQAESLPTVEVDADVPPVSDPSPAPPAEAATPAVPESTSATPAPPSPAAPIITVPQSSPSRAKKIPMSPERVAWFTQAPENMDLYIRFGAEAYCKTRAECEASLRSANCDWLAFKPENEIFPWNQGWKDAHYAGYFWHGASLWRHAHGIAVKFPEMGRLMREINRITSTMVPWNAFLTLFHATNNFDLIRFRIGRLGQDMILDEGILAHGLVRPQLETLSSKNDGTPEGARWLDEEYARMSAAKETQSAKEYHV